MGTTFGTLWPQVSIILGGCCLHHSLHPYGVRKEYRNAFIVSILSRIFGCAPLAIVDGVLADFWDPVDRGIATALFAGATFGGPTFGHPVLLKRKARRLRRQTQNRALHSALEEYLATARGILVKYLLRPIQMLMLEPILLCVAIYTSHIYGILYLFFEAYPISFQEVCGWRQPGVTALPFPGILIGVLCGAGLIIYFTKIRFAKKLKQHGQVVPKERLAPMIIASFFLPIGLFCFGWASSPQVSWVPQVFAGIPIGAGILVTFMQGLNYLIDTYLISANSAIAANTLIRSGVGVVSRFLLYKDIANLE